MVKFDIRIVVYEEPLNGSTISLHDDKRIRLLDGAHYLHYGKVLSGGRVRARNLPN